MGFSVKKNVGRFSDSFDHVSVLKHEKEEHDQKWSLKLWGHFLNDLDVTRLL